MPTGVPGDQGLDPGGGGKRLIPVPSMDHGEEIVGPQGQAARAAIAVAHAIQGADAFAQCVDLGVVDVPDGHAIAAQAQAVVVRYGTDAPDGPRVQQPLQAGDDGLGVRIDALGQLGEGLRLQGETRLGGCDQGAVEGVRRPVLDGVWSIDPADTHRAGVVQVQPESQVILLELGEVVDDQTRLGLEAANGGVETVLGGRGQDEPHVQGVVPAVVVGDLGACVQHLGDALEVPLRYRHGGQRKTPAKALGVVERAEPGQQTRLQQRSDGLDQGRFIRAQCLGRLQVGARAQRKTALVAVDQGTPQRAWRRHHWGTSRLTAG